VTSGTDIASMRWSLGLTPQDEADVRASAAELAGAIPGWVDAFYARQVTDPVAMAILSSEARIVRLKRTLSAWFHELFALPLDAGYERTRAEIGRVHVAIGMPPHLMVTAMSGVRADVRATVLARLSTDPARAARVAAALEKVLDLELCLMLSAYVRAARRASLRRDRELLLRRLGERLAAGVRDARDAAACYGELLRAADRPAQRERWAARLAGALECVARGEAGGASALAALDEDLQRACIAALVERAVADVGAGPVDVRVEPAGLEGWVHVEALRQMLTELLRDALRGAGAGPVRLRSARSSEGDLLLEVLDASRSWLRGVSTLTDALARPREVGVALAEHVAGLHGGEADLRDDAALGRGVRLRLPGVAAT
jgi:hypothetical protein